MFSFLKKRAVLIVLGFILLAIFIWWALGYLSPVVRGYQLDAYPVRLIVIGVVIGLWALVLLVKRLRAKQAGQKLMAAVVRQSESAKERPSAEALQLRERFEEAVATLGARKRGRHSLYDLPWYIIIGAPGSGKTTALVNSGLHFPVDQRTGRGALRGVGGTRNCDWWFTDEAVFLDTAGRYTTQDSDAGSDSAAWGEFLTLLRKYRQRRPVNGVLVAMSAQDLMVQGHAAREEHVAAVRRRLEELNAQFGIQLPVYLLITKCDLVAGFTEYFDDLTQEGRAQVWGVTFPYEVTRNSDAAATFPEEFDALALRLNDRVFGRVQDVGDPRRRARAFGFPQQIAALRGPLSEFIAEVFRSTKFDKTILLRGIYFTSGTQEGTPIDRLLGAIGRRFSVAPDAVVPAGRGKAYFIERLLKEVVIPEAGLAGVNRRLEVRKAASQLGAYAAMIAVAVLGVLALSVSYARNAAYVRDVHEAVAALQRTPAVPETAAVEQMLPRLDAVQQVYDVANRHNVAGVPLMMRWGLYQGSALGDAAQKAYVDVLNGPLLARVAERFRERINGYASDPILLYAYLKGYLILLQPPAHPRADADDVKHLRWLADEEWKAPTASEAETGPLMLRHFNNLLTEASALRPIPRDAATDTLVASAQSSVREASIARLAYLRLRRASEEDVDAALRLDRAAGVRSEELLRRKDGKSLSVPVLSLFTKKVFEQLAADGATSKLIAPLAREQWVWGQDMPKRSAADLEAELFDAYEKEYIEQWEAVLKAIDTKPPSTLTQAADALPLQAAALRNVLRTIDAQTFLIKPAAPKSEAGIVDKATEKAGQLVSPFIGKGKPALSRADLARQRITARFDELHKLVAGESAPIERALGQMGELKEKLKKVGGGVGQTPAANPQAQAEINDATRALKTTAAELPPKIGGMFADVAGRVESVVIQGARGDLVSQYTQAVAADCRDFVSNRYPLNRNATMEATPADFGRVFGYGGTFDRFFTATLEPLVDVTRRPWAWKPTLGDAPAGPAWMLPQFEAARRIRDNFFRPGSQMLELSFRVSPVELDAAVTKFTLRIDGQTLTYQHGPEPIVRMNWPGPVGEAIVTFADKSPVPVSIAHTDSNWALFHLIDNATQVQVESETRHVVTFSKNGVSARLRFEFDSNRNPFYKRDALQQFRCGA